MIPGRVSIIIPSRNEPYLTKTIQDLLAKASGDIEVIAVLDGYWPPADQLLSEPRVNYLHFSAARGMRNAINSAVAISKGEFLLKCDAHCLFGDWYDKPLKEDCQEDWVIVPRRYALNPEKWEIENNPKYPVDYMYLTNDLHGAEWAERNQDPALKEKLLDELMSAQGSCWFMRRSYFDFLELMDEAKYGTFWQEFQEVGLKCWLSGGRVMVSKKTYYAHWHKPSTVGRGYSLPEGEKDQTKQMVNRWLTERVWHKQIHEVRWLVDHFKPVPTWTP